MTVIYFVNKYDKPVQINTSTFKKEKKRFSF